MFAVYICDDPACGLRFPVAPGDRFRNRCPRCGGPVTLAAQPAPPPVARPAAPLLPAPPIALLLDNWRSLFNVGAVFRTADGAGVRPLYLCGITPTPAHPKLAKTALGAEQVVPWGYHPDGAACAAGLKAEGYRLWVLEETTGAVSLFDCLPPTDGRPLVLAAGNERTGVDPAILALADAVVYLPMLGVKESLNVAVAVSIAVYWLRGRSL